MRLLLPLLMSSGLMCRVVISRAEQRLLVSIRSLPAGRRQKVQQALARCKLVLSFTYSTQELLCAAPEISWPHLQADDGPEQRLPVSICSLPAGRRKKVQQDHVRCKPLFDFVSAAHEIAIAASESLWPHAQAVDGAEQCLLVSQRGLPAGRCQEGAAGRCRTPLQLSNTAHEQKQHQACCF